MDEVVIILLVMFLGVILDLIKKAQQKKQPPPPVSEQEEEEAGAEPVLAKSIQDLIAEELGLNLERRPSVEAPPEPESDRRRLEAASSEWASTRQAAAQPPEVYHPAPPDRERQHQPASAADRAAELRARQRTELAERRSLEIKQRGQATKRRVPGEARSLERPRRPEDHDQFHERYGVPQPVSSHSEFHERYMATDEPRGLRRQGPLLPDHPHWTAAQKAIIWAEILGPPKGLSE